jgi:hypothetical protein
VKKTDFLLVARFENAKGTKGKDFFRLILIWTPNSLARPNVFREIVVAQISNARHPFAARKKCIHLATLDFVAIHHPQSGK